MTNNLQMAFACSVVPNLVTEDCRTGVFFLRLVRDNLMLVVGAAGRVPAASFFCAWLGTILGRRADRSFLAKYLSFDTQSNVSIYDTFGNFTDAMALRRTGNISNIRTNFTELCTI